jgi:hypothetical protein
VKMVETKKYCLTSEEWIELTNIATKQTNELEETLKIMMHAFAHVLEVKSCDADLIDIGKWVNDRFKPLLESLKEQAEQKEQKNESEDLHNTPTTNTLV